MVFIFQVTATATEKAQEQVQKPSRMIDQLLSNPKTISLENYSPTGRKVIPNIKKYEDLEPNFHKLSIDDQARLITELALAANKQFGEKKAKEILTLLFQQLGLTQALIAAILKAAAEAKSSNFIIQLLTQQIIQNYAQQAFTDDQDKQKRLVAELSDGKEGPKVDGPRDYEPKEK